MNGASPASSEALLCVDNLTLTFGGLRALDAVSLTVTRGSISGLIGPNGAGKTSMLNCISRFYQPSSGSIQFQSIDLLSHPAHALAGLGIARTFQQMELFSSMTVRENTLVGTHARYRRAPWAEALGLPLARRHEQERWRAAEEVLRALDLEAAAEQPVRALPLGLQKRVGIARALAAQPRLLLLDEPAGGLNSTEKRELTALLQHLQRELALTILLIEHDMDLVMTLCDTLTVLDFGKRIAVGTPAEIQRDPVVIEAYLGKVDD